MTNGFKKAIYNIYKTFWLPSILIFYGCDQSLHSQKDYSKEKKRLEYLCLGNGLKNLISIDQEGVKIYSSDGKKENKPEFTLYWDETKYFIELTKNVSIDSMEKIYFSKGNSKFDKIISANESSITPSKGLKGKKIAIDPGHFAGDLNTAKIEQKFLDFKYKFDQGDSTHIQIAEGILTWQTAYLLKKSLEEQGAEVVLTREEINSTSFGKSYEAWFKDDKIKTLDSLRNTGKLKEKEYKKLISLSKSKFFWEFFRDFELANRVKVMNKFKPDLSVIIHYNVDEKNTDWKKPTVKNFTMAFIGGGMTSDNFEKTSHKINFLRLLLSEDLDQSEKISKLTVDEFSKNLRIKIAGSNDADYLKDKCVKTSSEGVFCRNLALCRGIISPLVYGESLYQDNVNECLELIKNDKTYFNIKTNQRVKLVSESYFNAIKKFYE